MVQCGNCRKLLRRTRCWRSADHPKWMLMWFELFLSFCLQFQWNCPTTCTSQWTVNLTRIRKKLILKCHNEHVVFSWVYSAPGTGCKGTSDFNKCVIFYWPLQEFTPHQLYPLKAGHFEQTGRHSDLKRPQNHYICLRAFTPVCFVLSVYVHDSRLSVIKLRIETQIEKLKVNCECLLKTSNLDVNKSKDTPLYSSTVCPWANNPNIWMCLVLYERRHKTV